MTMEYLKRKGTARLAGNPTPSFYDWITEARAEGFAHFQSLAGDRLTDN